MSNTLEVAARQDSDTYTQGPGAEPTLTDREAMETDLIRALISSYFSIVRESIADQVPKAVMHLLVNHCKDVVQSRLVSELYKESMFEELLYEDDGVKKEREKCEGLLQTYSEAAKIISEVRSLPGRGLLVLLRPFFFAARTDTVITVSK